MNDSIQSKSNTATEGKPEKARPKVTVEMFRQGVAGLNRDDFEEWCSYYQTNAAVRFQRAKTVLCAMKRIGLPQSAWQSDADKVQVWGEQLAESEVLSGANCEEIALDYSDPVVLKYFALFLWLGGDSPYTNGLEDEPIDWRRHIAEDLMQATVFRGER